MSGDYNSESLDSKITLLLVRSELDQKERAEFRKCINEKLDGLTSRADVQNGKIAKAMLDIAELKDNKPHVDQIIFWKKVIFNRYFLIGVGLLSALIIKFPIIGLILSLLKGI